MQIVHPGWVGSSEGPSGGLVLTETIKTVQKPRIAHLQVRSQILNQPPEKSGTRELGKFRI